MSIIDKTILFVKSKLEQAEGGHDWFHIERVYKNALLIAQEESCDFMENFLSQFYAEWDGEK